MSKSTNKEDLFDTTSILLYIAALILGIVSGFIYGLFF
nr:MAG TPA: Protein of unknown function (DUF1043) [Caudoviricetes sp.]